MNQQAESAKVIEAQRWEGYEKIVREARFDLLLKNLTDQIQMQFSCPYISDELGNRLVSLAVKIANATEWKFAMNYLETKVGERCAKIDKAWDAKIYGERMILRILCEQAGPALMAERAKSANETAVVPTAEIADRAGRLLEEMAGVQTKPGPGDQLLPQTLLGQASEAQRVQISEVGGGNQSEGQK